VGGASDYEWIVFSSRNGVNAFFVELDRTGRDARHFGGAKIAAIGPATARALTARGIRADFIPPRYVGEDIAAGLIPRLERGARVLLFRAEEARDVLPRALREAGASVDVVGAYRALAVRDPQLLEKVERCSILTFTSAGTVRAFAAHFSDAAAATRGKTIACIGPVTAEAAREAGLWPALVADEFSAEGLLEALTREPVPDRISVRGTG
ncbi:MAG: uroporphyrinogen-III synthase, partial [Candidatus Eremiobacteraeota bacterium]|nr:uroporphyrinogen-III synthase [Candidatus Eremiobacteraeota bacterium]MBV8355012.1 uroporphyrinogen-III synthase [Candidatus Eremiobacteraeota bacterium]